MAMRNPTQMFFCQLRFKNDSFISERDLAMLKVTNCLLLFLHLKRFNRNETGRGSGILFN